ncbi:PopZ family protein [Hyphomonas sp.]|uniref:PopZ family protein n=1 Tax=Hyphomonas sp. TaxID=87 RepID=UPI003918A431
MANEAHKEPTMEEILASIRKIISDDEPVATRPAPAATLREVPPPAVNDFEDFEDAIAGDELEDDTSMFEAEEEEVVVLAPEPAPAPRLETKVSGPSFTFEEMLGSARQAAAESVPVESTPTPRVAPAPAPTPVPESPMPPSSARYAQTALTDDHTADIAAGALGKLISKMEVSGDNTIEGLVKELLKPMIKEWLDANLATIVEEKVEAEVQRIARMAR